MYAVFDTFNEKVYSRHRTIDNAIKAIEKFNREFARNNPPNSYIPLEVRHIDSSGDTSKLSENDHEYVIMTQYHRGDRLAQ